MGRHSCCQKQKLKKGLWSPEEDEKLVHYITKYGHGCWSTVPKQAGLQRCGKSCRLRWINYLRPDLKRGIFSADEEKLIIDLHKALGNRWSQIATHLPGRTDNEIKNYWNTCIKKKLRQAGIDPNTHNPMSDNPETSTTSSTNPTNIQHQASEDLSEPPSKRPKMYPAVLEDILFAPRQVSLDKKGELPKSEQQQQQQHSQHLTTDNFLGKFLASTTSTPVESKIAQNQNQNHGSAESPPGFKRTTDNLLEKFIASPSGPGRVMQNFQQLQVNHHQPKPEFSFPVAAAAAYTSPILWVLHGHGGGGSGPSPINVNPSPTSTSTSTSAGQPNLNLTSSSLMEVPFGSLADLSSFYADNCEVTATAGMNMIMNPVARNSILMSSSSSSTGSHGQQQQQQQQQHQHHQHHHITGGWENLCSSTTTSSTTGNSAQCHQVTQTQPLTSVAPGAGSTRPSTLLHWNYSHKLESSDGSCESHDQLPMHEIYSDNQHQQHYHHHHHHHHQHHNNNNNNNLKVTSEPLAISSSSCWPSSVSVAAPPLLTGVDLSSATSFGPMSPELQRLAAVIDQM